MNIRVKYKEQCGGCEAEVWLSKDVPDGWTPQLMRGELWLLHDDAKEAVQRQLSDSPSKKDCCP